VQEIDVAIVGAGPYGLATAAHATGLHAVVFGHPMQTWKRMQPDMQLRAVWERMTLTAPGGRGTLDEWMAATGAVRKEPMTPPDLIAYADWYRQHYVAEHVEADVRAVSERGGRFLVETEAGEWLARALVVAVGVTPFAVRPSFLSVDDARILPAADRDRFEGLDGAKVAVVGGGQSAVEAAAYARRAGADVTLATRGELHWFTDRRPAPQSRLRSWLYRVAYPEQGVGPPPINRLVPHPDLFATLPGGVRDRLTRRLLRPGASPWLRSQLDGVRIREHAEVVAVEPSPEGLRVPLGDGTALEVDVLLLGTGYRFSLDRLDFLPPPLRAGISVRNAWPALDRSFRSSDARICFVGFPAEGTFGPLCRFVRGAHFSATRVTDRLRASLA
jgi:NADPH-dependent 2,4-dienoyl-CoA reductase/sulfur reductase-like enzyme